MKEKIVYKFKKGQVIHLDSIIDISAFVLKEGYSEPYKNEHLEKWDASTSDEHIIIKNFSVTIIINE